MVHVTRTDERPKRPAMSLSREIAFVLLICSAQMLTQAGLALAIAPLHIIGESLGTAEPGVLSWYAAGYSLSVGTFILISGRAGDLFGHKKMFFFGFSWFGIWSIICGLTRYSRSNEFFIIARVMQGIGPAIVLPNGLAILGKTYPPSPRKTAVFSIFGATAPSGFNLGAVFTSLLAQRVNWSWAYYVTGIVCFLVAATAVFVIPEDDEHKHEKRALTKLNFTEIASQLDIWAAIVGISGLVLFNIAWNEAPVVGWRQAWIITVLIVSIALFALFAYLESSISRHPLIPPEIFNRQTSLILGCISAGWASFGIWVYYLFLFLELQRGYSPLAVSAQLVPTTIAGLCAAVVVTLFLARIGAGLIMFIAMTCFMAGNLFLSLMPVQQTYWALTFVATIVTPFGMDMSFPAANVVISDFVESGKQGNAASLVNTILNYSISIGLGIAGTVEVNVNRGGTTMDDLLFGYRAAWRVGVGLAGLGMFLALCLTYFVAQAKKHGKVTSEKAGSEYIT